MSTPKKVAEKKYIIIDFLNGNVETNLSKQAVLDNIVERIEESGSESDVLDPDYTVIIECETGKKYTVKRNYDLKLIN